MAFTYGFYNSVNHDRVYDATQFMNLFDGILIDGVFMSVGDHFAITPRSGRAVLVGSGRAWFNGTWSWNSTALVVSVPESDLVYDRYDAIVLEINKNTNTRRNRIFCKKGTPGANPKKPTMVRSGNIYQYALGYIEVAAESTEVTALDIENVVGHEETPYCTGLIQVHNVDAIWSQWEARFNEWFKKLQDSMGGDVAGNLLGMIMTLQDQVKEILAKWPSMLTGTKEPAANLGKNEDFYYRFGGF